MTQAQRGDTVKIHFTGKLPSGEVFDSSFDREPAHFTLGEQTVVPGVEEAIVGMEEGETKTVVLPPDKAYGESRSELVVDVERQNFPEGVDPEVGQRLRFLKADGREIVATVKSVSDSTVVVDANHPLSGEAITFDIELVQIL